MAKQFCSRPFELAEVRDDGSVYACCSGWMPHPIGNVRDTPLLSIWNGQPAQDVRRRLLNGDFSLCGRCPFVGGEPSRGNPIVDTTAIDDPIVQAIYDAQSPLAPRISELNLASDRTCNLSCPSCRTGVFVASGEALRQAERFHRSLAGHRTLDKVDWLYLTGSGDPFASHTFREMIRAIDPVEYPNLRLRLHTNALLFDEKNWQALGPARALVQRVEISIDAANADTYRINRRGGDWRILMDNLHFVADLRRSGQFDTLQLSFLVQANNWRQMRAFVSLAAKVSADMVFFTPLRNWGTFTQQEFVERAVHLPGHPEHEAYAEYVRALPLPLIRSDRFKAYAEG